MKTSILKNKKDIKRVIESSTAHKWLADNLTQNKTTSENLPSTDGMTFWIHAFYKSVQLVVEHLIVTEKLPIDEAIAEGNTLAQGEKIVVNSPATHQYVKDALMYLKSIQTGEQPVYTVQYATKEQMKAKVKYATKTAKSKVKCNRTAAVKGCSPHTKLRLTSFFDWIDDPEYTARAVKGLKSWSLSNAHRLTVADQVNIDYVLGCYQ